MPHPNIDCTFTVASSLRRLLAVGSFVSVSGDNMEQVDYFRAGVAVAIFVAGFLLSRIVERRKNRNQLKKNSVEAILPLLAAWQGKLADLTGAGLRYGIKSNQYGEALHEFQKASSIANELEMHVTVLKLMGGCEALVDEVYTLFGGHKDMHIDQTVGMHIRHGFHAALMETYADMVGSKTESTPSVGSWENDWRKNAMVLDFERWSQRVQQECAKALSRL
ncbi:hypothetical protein [Loktanella sp. SALINAS62]|uniref:hypothetical protein n=1 Tax=Loktanella sp. SALINAS62 TaxID=2706124 RepID=UPI001B8C663F|nr:hypothetical protein [Loktanella sp. SALINAS62]MBS1301976.1 hypothetical protein [Loktanella sp. SALINAS62]